MDNNDITEQNTISVSESHHNSHNNTSVTQQVKRVFAVHLTHVILCARNDISNDVNVLGFKDVH